MEMQKKIGLLLGIFTVLLLESAFPLQPQAEKQVTVREASLTGRIFCVNCELKRRAGADAECHVFGHQRVLRVASCTDAAGKPIPALNNVVLHFLVNEKSQMILRDPALERKHVLCRLRGKVYPDFSLLELTSKQIIYCDEGVKKK
ncbi:MAG: hypothetical protein HYU64_12535 [Armatimonadetes bacterium]|nr:hypothetical protein [Armatimonadota bacterium]